MGFDSSLKAVNLFKVGGLSLCLTLAAKASNLTTKTCEIGYVKAASCRINSVFILGIYKENEWKI